MLKKQAAIHGRPTRRDFWRAWQEEREDWQKVNGGNGHERPSGSQASPELNNSPEFRSPNGKGWRDYFQDFMGTPPEQHWAFRDRRFAPWHHGFDDFNPFLAALLSKGGAILPIYMLHLLAQQPRYAKELLERIIELTGGQWTADPATIYPLMTMLEDHGLVEGAWVNPSKRTVRVYRLTREGHSELERLKAIVRPKLEEAAKALHALVDDLGSDVDEPAFEDDVDTVYLQRGF